MLSTIPSSKAPAWASSAATLRRSCLFSSSRLSSSACMFWNISICSLVSCPAGAVEPLLDQTDSHFAGFGSSTTGSFLPNPSNPAKDVGSGASLGALAFGAGAGCSCLRFSCRRLTYLSGPKQTSKRPLSSKNFVTEPCCPFSWRPPSDSKPWTVTQSPTTKAGVAGTAAGGPLVATPSPLCDLDRDLLLVLLLLLRLLLLRDLEGELLFGPAGAVTCASSGMATPKSTLLRFSAFRLTSLSGTKRTSKRPVLSMYLVMMPVWLFRSRPPSDSKPHTLTQ
mmetsp:Transcript_50918/g.114513  ORF Transcript_50918/g.114513 Transcript_50918/m.114513 type:complete len:280 (+) Transcript_50918:258-1097(+)